MVIGIRPVFYTPAIPFPVSVIGPIPAIFFEEFYDGLEILVRAVFRGPAYGTELTCIDVHIVGELKCNMYLTPR